MPTVAVWLTEDVYRTWLRLAEDRATTTSEIAKRAMTRLTLSRRARWNLDELIREPLP
jgi:hypothetical protein